MLSGTCAPPCRARPGTHQSKPLTTMRYRIALCGFSEFEYRAMHFSFLHPSGFRDSEYEVVDALGESDFAVVDADSQPAVKGVVQSGRLPRALFVGGTPPPGAAGHLPRPIDTSRILRALDALTAAQTAPAAFRDEPTERVFPTLNDVVETPLPPTVSRPGIPLAPLVSPVSPASPVEADLYQPLPGDAPDSGHGARVPTPEEPVDSKTRHAQAKAAARAAARRARLASAQRSSAAAETLRDVLVLDADRSANTALCLLLERFGFESHPVYSAAKADAELLARPYAAVFLDVALDDEGVDLLQRIGVLPRPASLGKLAVVMMRAHLDPADRVRAALAGVTAPLIKPLARGDVARALESAGVILPADARRL